MKLVKADILSGIDSTVVKNGTIDYFCELELEQFRFDNGNINHSDSFNYFIKKYSDDIVFYKQEKKSGYNCVALYKGVTMVGIGDFMTKNGKIIKSLNKTDVWHTHSLYKLQKAVLSKYFKNIYDNRCRYPTIKPSAVMLWGKISDVIFDL